MLDFEGSLQSLGKPALADLKAGLATAPVLLAAEEHPRLQVLTARKFAEPGDVGEALALVKASKGLARAKDLAIAQVRRRKMSERWREGEWVVDDAEKGP